MVTLASLSIPMANYAALLLEELSSPRQVHLGLCFYYLQRALILSESRKPLDLRGFNQNNG
jgi:hypothetical protein